MSVCDPTVYRYKILQNKEKINEKTREVLQNKYIF